MLLFNEYLERKQRMSLTSLYFQSFLYYDNMLTNLLLPFQLFLFIYKYNSLVYSTNTMAGEIILLILAFFLNLLRLHLGNTANKSKSIPRFIGYYFLTLTIIMGFVYMIVWQPYVYWLEFIMYIMAIVIVGI